MTHTAATMVEAGKKATTVLVADDHPVVCIGIRNILKGAAGIAFVGQAQDGQEALDSTKKLNPDILLLDLAMPKLAGMDVLRELVQSGSHTRVLLLTAVLDKKQLLEALELGARGIILKDSAAEDVVIAINTVMDGQYWFGRKAVSNLVQILHSLMEEIKQPVPQAKFGLTTRESQMIGAIIQGGTNKDIAQQFSISEDTVKRHLTNIFDKLGVSNRLELALFAIHHNLVAKPD